MQGDSDENTPAEAKRMAEKYVAMVQRNSGAVLDYSPGTLEAVDLTVDQVKATGATAESASGMLYAIGCYVGEVFVRHAKGEWRSTADMKMSQVCSWPLVIALPNGAGINPIGKVFKRFNNGPEDNLAFFYAAAIKEWS
jgi:hypothetical protein